MPPSAQPPRSADELQRFAARVMVGTALFAAVLLLVTASFDELGGHAGTMSRLRAGFGLLLLGVGLTGRWLLARSPAWAVSTILIGTVAAGWLHAIGAGVGIHGIGLVAAVIAIVLSGAVSSARLTVALAVLHALLLVAAAAAERQGWLQGIEIALRLTIRERLVAQLTICGAAAAAGWLIANMLQQSLRRALEQEALSAQLLRIGSDWSWETDARARMLHVAGAFEASTGRTVAEFLNVGLPGGPEVVRDDTWRACADDYRALRAYRDRVFTIRFPDGAQLWLQTDASPVFDARGRCTGWRGVSRNVTEQRRAQIEQLRTRSLLDRLFDAHPEAVCVARIDDGRLLSANPSFLAATGLSLEQCVGRDPLQLGLWRDMSVPKALYKAVQSAEGQVRDLRCTVYLRGQPRAMAITAARFQWDDRPVAVYITRDLTEIEQARAQAEAASRAKSDFLATMSHEIRTPLNGVIGLARLAQDPTLAPARRAEYLQHLLASAEMLSGLVSDVLDLSKIEAGHLHLEALPFDLPAVVHKAFEGYAPLGREKGLGMHCLVAADVPRMVIGDPLRVRQIVANYLSNALKFTAAGSVELRLERAAGARVRLEVADTGIGTEPSMRAHLFEPFAQAERSTTRRYGGTGLGLSICRELAERMGGAVGVESNGERGSRFWAEFELPEHEPAAAEPPTPENHDHDAPLTGLTLLVAEDNAVNMLIVASMLRRLGAQVHEAVDGAQACALVFDSMSGRAPDHPSDHPSDRGPDDRPASALGRAPDGATRTAAAPAAAGNPVDAVLMDLHMPELDGYEATRRLRADARTRTLPIFALSAAVLEHERARARSIGMNGFIGKPVVEDELLNALAPLAQAARRQPAAAAGAAPARPAADAQALRADAAAPAPATAPGGGSPSEAALSP